MVGAVWVVLAQWGSCRSFGHQSLEAYSICPERAVCDSIMTGKLLGICMNDVVIEEMSGMWCHGGVLLAERLPLLVVLADNDSKLQCTHDSDVRLPTVTKHS